MQHWRSLVAGILLLHCAFSAFGQDSQYWVNEFGTRSALLSGAVLAGYEDNSMVFYNPGAIGLIDSGSVSLNASLYQLERFRTRKGERLNTDSRGTEIGNIPLTFAGLLNFNIDNRLTFGYGYAAPLRFNFNLDERFDGFLNLANEEESPGLEEVIIQDGIRSSLAEDAITFTCGYRLTDNLGLGVSLVGTGRSHRYTNTFGFRMVLNSEELQPEFATVSRTAFMRYFQVRMHAEAGLSYMTDTWSFGFTFSSPAFTIYSEGEVSGEILATNVAFDRIGRVSILGNDEQKDLNARFKTPVVLGVGATRKLPRASLNLSAQLFTGIENYELLNPEPQPFFRPGLLFDDAQSDEFLTVYEGARPVFNVAFGFEYSITNSFGLKGGARTNFTYLPEDIYDRDAIGIQPQISNWDIYYLTLGFTLRNERNDLTVGFQYGYGRGEYSRLGGIGDTEADFLLRVLQLERRTYYHNAGLIVGYNYIFRSKSRDKAQ